MELNVTPVYVRNALSVADVVANEGGMRSGKTYGICQHLTYDYALGINSISNIPRKNRLIEIVRKTRAELVGSVYADFLEILEHHNLYRPSNHNKSRLEYNLNGSLFKFTGIDQAQKKRGPKRDILFVNEANGISLEDWIQLSGRTTERVFLDWNPSEDFWFYDAIEESPDYLEIDSVNYDAERDNPLYLDERFGRERRKQTFERIHSTYLENFDNLQERQILEIENFINQDDYYDKVYRLGIRAKLRGSIYNNFELISPEAYDKIPSQEIFYGCDFGYQHPTVLVEMKYWQEKIYEREIYRAQYKYDDDLIEFMDDYGIHQNDEIWCDAAYPASIDKMVDAGYNALRANKTVEDGIRMCQSLSRFIDKSCNKYVKETRRYKNKQLADGTIVETPVKIDDDGPDAFRYGAYNQLKDRIWQRA